MEGIMVDDLHHPFSEAGTTFFPLAVYVVGVTCLLSSVAASRKSSSIINSSFSLFLQSLEFPLPFSF